MYNKYDVRIGKEFKNSSGKIRRVLYVHTDYAKKPSENRDTVTYVKVGDSREIGYSCSMGQFVRWING